MTSAQAIKNLIKGVGVEASVRTCKGSMKGYLLVCASGLPEGSQRIVKMMESLNYTVGFGGNSFDENFVILESSIF